MAVDKQQILDVIGQHGTPDQLAQAAQALPQQVDPAQLAQYAEQIGVDPQLLSSLQGGVDPGSIIDQATGGDLGQAEGLLSKLLGLFGG